MVLLGPLEPLLAMPLRVDFFAFLGRPFTCAAMIAASGPVLAAIVSGQRSRVFAGIAGPSGRRWLKAVKEKNVNTNWRSLW